jgi:UDP-glucose 4-epimerase
VYAPSDHPCVEDATPLQPLEVYGESKMAAEGLVRAFHDDTGTPSSVLRLFNAIGRNETNPHVVPHIFESLRNSDEIRLGNTAPRRDYIDTRDIAEAIVAVAGSSDGLRVFNVGSGRAYSVEDILESLRRLLGRPITAMQEASRVRDTERMLLVADIGKITGETGWRPRLTLEDTLKDLVDAYGLETAPREME